MSWMNRDEVEESAQHWFDQETQPNLHRGAQVLLKLMVWTDGCSDGWPYWHKPSRAAEKLMTVLHDKNRDARYGRDEQDITDAELRKLLTPIKSFLTRQDVDHETLLADEPAPVESEPEGSLFNVITPEERALLSEAVHTAIERQQDTLDYAKNHMEGYDPDDVEYMKKRLGALERLAGKV